MIAVNTGFGDDYSAAQEVEYANGSDDTIGGSWRVENGHEEPYRREVLVRRQRNVGTVAAWPHATQPVHAKAQSRRRRDATKSIRS